MKTKRRFLFLCLVALALVAAIWQMHIFTAQDLEQSASLVPGTRYVGLSDYYWVSDRCLLLLRNFTGQSGSLTPSSDFLDTANGSLTPNTVLARMEQHWQLTFRPIGDWQISSDGDWLFHRDDLLGWNPMLGGYSFNHGLGPNPPHSASIFVATEDTKLYTASGEYLMPILWVSRRQWADCVHTSSGFNVRIHNAGTGGLMQTINIPDPGRRVETELKLGANLAAYNNRLVSVRVLGSEYDAKARAYIARVNWGCILFQYPSKPCLCR